MRGHPFRGRVDRPALSAPEALERHSGYGGHAAASSSAWTGCPLKRKAAAFCEGGGPLPVSLGSTIADTPTRRRPRAVSQLYFASLSTGPRKGCPPSFVVTPSTISVT